MNEQGVPMNERQGGFSQTISALIDNDVNENVVGFLKLILMSKDIPLSNLKEKDVRFHENTLRYLKGLYIASNDVSDEEYNMLEALELACISRIKRSQGGFERKTLQKQIRESVTSSNDSNRSFLSKLFGKNGGQRR